ncbi:alpha/beta fold hydrolase [Nonomuraea jabiensis]|uniref:4,5:9,10-diseco-3-hydroxy-5,9, 17-trioxoandrosta-1(10),2-diene-4-oate hydrolase n=1 Tax=Nonomuraea jabiensis TaxID=882448 RepID=A0A7W9GDJ0_9ACTN|nr:alpha/beta fold hydrolase [Nonomuraea jabiensis]MBB5781815.1 4,5:9,10-diseco-3-hydroxy-5,9,17-trioxoandrosta-1(10),2-diene-4-oate hydrolase [Nonomuraea jabiensis]
MLLHETYLDTEVIRFHYARAGNGPPVLLLPGSGGWKLTFQAMLEVLAPQYTVYALDPPGQGAMEILDRALSLGADGIARSIAGFLDGVGVRRPAIVGHSWGGGFALRFAELHPDRVARLALIAPGGLDVRDTWEFRLARLPLGGELAVRLALEGSARHLVRKSFAHRERVPKDRLDDYVHMMKSSRLRATLLADMLRMERSVRWSDTEQDLRLVNMPVLLLWGSEDRVLPASVEEHVVSGGGHSLHDDCPEETYALLLPFLGADHA